MRKVIKMKKKRNRKEEVRHPENSRFSSCPEHFGDTSEYIGFASNGMTDNEHIDEFNYYNNFLTEKIKK